MALRKIVVDGDEILKKKCRPVETVNDRIRLILDDMVETMHEYNGVGLAAPQVGIMRRMFVAEPDDEGVIYMINPEIIETRGSEIKEEGCLSVPGYTGYVERPQYVKIKALDRDGNEVVYEAEGFKARVFCHENDHLDGILYYEKAEDFKKSDS